MSNRVTSDLHPPRVVSLRETQHNQPRCFMGEFEDEWTFICRYRWGMLTAYRCPPKYKLATEKYCIYREQIGDELDGYILYEDLRKALVDVCYLPKHYTNINNKQME